MIFSTKAVTQAVTSALTFIASALIARLGFHSDPAVTAAVPGLIAWLAGMLTAFIVREEALLAPTVRELDDKLENESELVSERFRMLESKLPAPERLIAQQVTGDLQTDAEQVVADVRTDVPSVVSDLSQGETGAAKDLVTADAVADRAKEVAAIEQQLRDLGVDPATLQK